MARVSFDEIAQWESQLGIKRAETARRLGVTSQTLNGWRVRGQVSADESDRVRALVSSSGGAMRLTTDQGSSSEPALPDDLSPMAKECITRIANAAARAEGKFDSFLAHIAAEIERTVDLPVKSVQKVRPMSKEQLSLVKTVTTMGGLVPDQQAAAVETMLWGYIKLQDPDAAKKTSPTHESKKMHGLDDKADLIGQVMESLMKRSDRRGLSLSNSELKKAARQVMDAVVLKNPSKSELARIVETEISEALKRVA